MKLNRHNPCQRRGTLIVAVLVCIVVASTIVLGTVHTSTRYRRHIRNDQRVEQARWLLDGGVRMAITKLRQQPDYKGETIVLDDNKSPRDGSTVIVRVIPSGNDRQLRLQVTAELKRNSRDQSNATPLDAPERRPIRAETIRRSTEILIAAPDET